MQDLSRQPADPLIGAASDDHEAHRFQNAGRHTHCPGKDRHVPQKAAISHIVASRLVRAAYGGAQLFRKHLQQHAFPRSRRRTQKNDTGGFAGDTTAKAGAGQKHHSRGIGDLINKTYTNLSKTIPFSNCSNRHAVKNCAQATDAQGTFHRCSNIRWSRF